MNYQYAISTTNANYITTCGCVHYIYLICGTIIHLSIINFYLCFFFCTRTWFSCTRRAAAARPLTLKWTAHTHTSESPLLLYTQQKKNANERKSLRAARAINSPTHTHIQKITAKQTHHHTNTQIDRNQRVRFDFSLYIFAAKIWNIFFFICCVWFPLTLVERTGR